MLCDAKRATIAAGSAAAMVSLMVLALMVPTAYAAVPDDAFIEDHGDMWGCTIQFVFAGSDAESIEWDFGDGSPISTEWNPRHTYSDIGEYIITQNVYNSFNGGSSATGYYRINVLGAPYVEFVQPDGAPALDKVYAYLDDATTDAHRTVVQPADPVWTGHEFQGWFADPELTAPFDWTQKLQEPVMAYVSWSDVAPGVTEHTLTIRGPDGTTVNTITVSDGATAVKPTAPEGKTVTYYTDEGLTNEYNWNTTITSDLTIYRKVVDATLDPEPESEKKVTVNGTEIVIVVVALVIGVAAVASRSVGLSVITLILIALAAVGILDIIDIPEIINGFGGVRL